MKQEYNSQMNYQGYNGFQPTAQGMLNQWRAPHPYMHNYQQWGNSYHQMVANGGFPAPQNMANRTAGGTGAGNVPSFPALQQAQGLSHQYPGLAGNMMPHPMQQGQHQPQHKQLSNNQYQQQYPQHVYQQLVHMQHQRQQHPQPHLQHYNQEAPQVPRAPAIPTPPRLSPRDTTSSADLHVANNNSNFGWMTIDSVTIPYLVRNANHYLSVRVVDTMLLSKYPNTYPREIQKLPTTFATESEAKLLNEINAMNSAFEYGKELFTKEDLIVTVGNFNDFYAIIKKHLSPLQSNFAMPGARSPPESMGGWIQINNTVVPYVSRQICGKFVPLPVIRYAAGLLTDNAIGGVEPTLEECIYLNQVCIKVGVNFTFDKSTKFIPVKALESLPDVVSIKELPKDDPFKHAEYHQEQGRTMHSPSKSFQPSSPPSLPGISPPTHRPPQSTGPRGVSGNAPAHYPGQSMNWPNTHFPGNMMSSGMDRMPAFGPPVQPPQVSPAHPAHVSPKATATSLFVPPASKSPRNNSPATGSSGRLNIPQQQPRPGSYEARTSHTVQQNMVPAPVAARTVGAKRPEISPPLPKDRLPKPTKLTPAQNMCFERITSKIVGGKALSCLNKGGFHYSLLEAIGKVFFPDCTQGDFVNVVETVLKLPVKKLLPDEEAAFIQLYCLPVPKLKCNKVVDVEQFEKFLPQFRYILQGEGDGKDAIPDECPAARHSPLTVTIQDSPMRTPSASDPKAVSYNSSVLQDLKDFVGRKRLAVDDLEKPQKLRRTDSTANQLKKTSVLGTNGRALVDCSRDTPESETDSSRGDLLMQGSRSSDVQDRSDTPMSGPSSKSLSVFSVTPDGVRGQHELARSRTPGHKTVMDNPGSSEHSSTGGETIRVDTAADGNLLIYLDD